jgi:uncharacterized protein YecT (DUF1311 family)
MTCRYPFSIYIFGLAMLAWAGSASAQELDCESAVTQQDMNLCAALDHDMADKELNAVWKKAKRAAHDLDSEQSDDFKGAEAALIAAQRGWIAYRDGHCELAGSRCWFPAAWPNLPAHGRNSSKSSSTGERSRPLPRGTRRLGRSSVLASKLSLL